MGEESHGLGAQYIFLDQPSQTAHSFAIGFSLNKKADVSFNYSSSDLSESGNNADYKLKTSSIQFTFFPAREENEEDLFTGEFLTGIGYTEIVASSGYMLFLGTGISKALFENQDETNLRPRVSAGYALSTLSEESRTSGFGYMSPRRTQVGVGISFSAELIADLRLNQSTALLIAPSMIYVPNERDTGFGFSISIIL